MSKEELTKWFWNKFNSCYSLYDNQNTNNIYWYYEEQFVRKLKLCKLNNDKITHSEFKGEFMFEQAINQKLLFCNNDNIWGFLKQNYSRDDSKIQIFINEILKNSEKFSEYKSYMTYNYNHHLLIFNKKFKLYE